MSSGKGPPSYQGTMCVGVGGWVGSAFSASPLFLPSSVSVGLLTIASLEAMSTILWLPKGTLPVPPQRHTLAYSKGYSEWPLFCSWERTTSPLASGHNRKCTLGTTSENK